MDESRGAPAESFLGRWSRRKTEARASPQPSSIATESQPPGIAQGPHDDAAPVLPRVEDLTIESDFRGFFHPKVDEDLRRSALRKLFADPHFNVMDGLDTYIDDYSQTEPIPPAMLAGLRQAQKIIQWAENREDEPQADVPPESAAEADGLEPPGVTTLPETDGRELLPDAVASSGRHADPAAAAPVAKAAD